MPDRTQRDNALGEGGGPGLVGSQLVVGVSGGAEDALPEVEILMRDLDTVC